MEYFNQFLVDFIEILNEMSPYLILGFFFAGVLKIAFPKKFIDKYLGQKNSKSVLYASLIGIPLPLCSCGVIPTGISFFKSGASKGSSVSFLISTPQTGVDSILVTYSLLGLPFAVIRPFIALFTGFFGGILANKIDASSTTTNTYKTETCCSTNKTDTCGCKPNNKQKPEKKSRFYTLFHYAFVEFLQDISKWLIIGLLLAAFISVLIPDDFFTDFIGNDLIGMLVILLSSIPLYICATSSVPVAAVLMMKGISPGAALVFLMAGPATNAATITVLNKVLGKKTMWAYLISIVLGALLFGLLIDNLLPREWFNLGGLHHHMTSHEGHWELPNWLKWTSSISLFLLIINGYVQKYLSSKKQLKADVVPGSTEEKLLTVNGMSCNHCKNSIEKHIGALENIETVEVNLEQKILRIVGISIDLNQIKQEIESLGFELDENVKK